MGVGILAKRVVLELGSSTNFVYSLILFPIPSDFLCDLRIFRMLFKPFYRIRTGKHCFQIPLPQAGGGFLHESACDSLSSQGIVHKGVIDFHRSGIHRRKRNACQNLSLRGFQRNLMLFPHKFHGSSSFRYPLLLSFLQLSAAPGAVFKVFLCLIAAGRAVTDFPLAAPAITAAGAVSSSNQRQILRADFRLLSPLEPPSGLGIKLVKALTAGSLRIIFSAPSEYGDKEQAQAHTGHIDLIPSIPPAEAADNRPEASDFFPV